MNRILKNALTAAICAACLSTAGGCAKKNKAPPQRPPVTVQTTEAIQMEAPVILDTFGNTKDASSINVVPQVSGMLLNTFIKDGAIVTNGQPLFLIDPSDYAARVKQTEGAVAADLANLELNQLTLERNQPLVDKGMISTEDFDAIKTKTAAARAQLQIDQAALEKARLDLARCSINATAPGICSKCYLDNGNLAAAGQTLLTNIRCYDPMQVDFTVSEQYLPMIRQAMAEGEVKIDVIPRGETNVFSGVLKFIDNAVDLQTGTILLRGAIPNPDMKLWSQQFVDVRVKAGSIPNAIMAPEGSIQYGKQGTYLYVVTPDEKAEMRPVKTGIRHRNLIQIAEGVAAGERVVALGQLMLYPGAAVMDTTKMAAAGGAGQPNAEKAPENSK